MLTPLFALACTAPSTPAPGPAPVAAFDVDDPATCTPCHAAVVQEWEGSMHARAHHDRDPVYAAMRTLRIDKQGPQVAEKCAVCHTPRDPGGASPVAQRGVSCATCHLAEAVDLAAGRGVQALRWGDTLRGPHDPSGVAGAHALGPASPALADGTTVCLACHNEEQNAAGVPTCTTGLEHAGAGPSCASCHMPEAATPSGAASTRTTHRSHGFVGPRSAWDAGDLSFLASAVDVSSQVADGKATVTLVNRTGHAFPTGFPARVVVVKGVGKDAAGAPVWTHFDQDPLVQDPGAVLGRAFADADGKPTLAPFAAQETRNTTLARDERRVFQWDVPPTVTSVEVTLLFRLLAPPAAKALGFEGQAYGEARPIVVRSFTPVSGVLRPGDVQHDGIQ